MAALHFVVSQRYIPAANTYHYFFFFWGGGGYDLPFHLCLLIMFRLLVYGPLYVVTENFKKLFKLCVCFYFHVNFFVFTFSFSFLILWFGFACCVFYLIKHLCWTCVLINYEGGLQHTVKHRENRKTLPREHLFGCQGVKMFLIKNPLKKNSS